MRNGDLMQVFVTEPQGMWAVLQLHVGRQLRPAFTVQEVRFVSNKNC